MAQQDVLFHPGAAQVKVTVAKTELFIHLDILIEGKGRRLRWIDDLGLLSDDLDLSGGEVWVLCSLGALRHLTGNPQHILMAQPGSNLVSLP